MSVIALSGVLAATGWRWPGSAGGEGDSSSPSLRGSFVLVGAAPLGDLRTMKQVPVAGDRGLLEASIASPPQTPRSPSHPSGGAGDAPSPSLRTSFFLGGGEMTAGALAVKAMAAVIGGGGLATAGGAAAAAGRVLDFRRRGAPPRRRRRSPLLALGKPLGIAAVTVALPLALGLWLLTSHQFQLRTIIVSGASAAPGAQPAPAQPPVRAIEAAGPLAKEPAAVSAVQAPPAGPPPAGTAARVPAAWVRQALAPLVGRNLLRLPLSEVRLRLAANPWIAAAEVAKELPDRLRVTVAERQPAVLLRIGEALLYADAAGRPIAPVGSPSSPAELRKQGLLVVSLPPQLTKPSPGPPMLAPPPAQAPPGAAAAPASPAAPEIDNGLTPAARAGVAGALRLAAQLRLLRPGWTPSLSQIDVVDEDDFQLRVPGLPCPLLVRGSRLADNLSRFEQLLPELRRRYPALAAVDLRYSRRIVVQPAPAPAAAVAAVKPPAHSPPPPTAGSRSAETL
jgi:hypothetical protein